MENSSWQSHWVWVDNLNVVNSLGSASFDALRYGVHIKVRARRGPNGHGTVALFGPRTSVVALLTRWGYDDDVIPPLR
jgi:hypothetical protein